MLLPSSLDCAPRKHPRTASYKPATTMLSPPTSTCQSPSSNMFSTCRALQSLLASNLPTLSPSPKIIRAPPPHLGSPIVLKSEPRAQSKKPKSHMIQSSKITKSQPRIPPRSNLKRRRSFGANGDDDDEHAPPRDDQENTTNPRPSTPKRQRTYPPSLPLGLELSDFDALNPASTTPPHTPEAKAKPTPSSSNTHTPTTTPADNPKSKPKPTNQESKPSNNKNNPNNADDDDNDDDETPWSTPDDDALVSLILNKLRLRQSDWDDCARQLGKGKDSIGRRWRHLLGDGEVGLRRGVGGRRRGGVEGMEFGGMLGCERERE